MDQLMTIQGTVWRRSMSVSSYLIATIDGIDNKFQSICIQSLYFKGIVLYTLLAVCPAPVGRDKTSLPCLQLLFVLQFAKGWPASPWSRSILTTSGLLQVSCIHS